MKLVGSTAGTELFQLQPLGVVPFVLGGGIGPLPALGAGEMNDNSGFGFLGHNYSMMRVTVPAPTVLPPSLIAKRSPASKATG